MPDDDYMERGKSQVLYRYLPENTFDYTGNYGIHKVESVEGVQLSGLDEHYIGQQVLNRVRAWEAESDSMGAIGFPNNPTTFRFISPREVKTSFFPLNFRCKTCERIHSYDDVSELSRYNGSLTCRRDDCDGEVQQHQFTFIHECGAIETPRPGECDNCGEYEYWEFASDGSQRFRNSYWLCRNCGNNQDIRSYCDECDLQDRYMTLTVHRASSAYLPQYLSVVDIGTGSRANAADGPFARSVVARYLGLTDERIVDIELDQREDEEEREDLEARREEYEEILEASEGDVPIVREKLEGVREELEQLESDRGSLGEEVSSLVPFLSVGDLQVDEDWHDAVYEVYQFVNTNSDLNRKPARRVIIGAGSDDPASREARRERARRVEGQLTELGIREAAFIDDFPVTNVVYGYSRVGQEPEEARLNAFAESQVTASGEGTPLFADTVETEAVQFTLSPEVTMEWLLRNSLLEGEEPSALRRAIFQSDLTRGRDIPVPNSWDQGTVANWLPEGLTVGNTEPVSDWSERDTRAWLLANMTSIPDYGPISLDDGYEQAVSYFVYQLVHSFSHTVLKHVTQLSGLSKTSLAEFLFPRSLSFVVYSNQRTDYNIGGLYTMVEASLRDLLDQVAKRGNTCVYDPVCSRTGSACHSCMHLSEVSCTHLNRNLGRDFLFGSKTSADRNINGYTNVAARLMDGE